MLVAVAALGFLDKVQAAQAVTVLAVAVAVAPVALMVYLGLLVGMAAHTAGVLAWVTTGSAAAAQCASSGARAEPSHRRTQGICNA